MSTTQVRGGTVAKPRHLLKSYETSAANTRLIVSTSKNYKTVRRLAEILVRYSGPVTQDVVVSYDAGQGSAYDADIATISLSSAASGSYLPPRRSPFLIPVGDAIEVTAPAGGVGVTCSITIVTEACGRLSAVSDATQPDAPTITAITPGNAQLSVAFTAGGDGGSPITDYDYRLNGGAWTSASGDITSPIVITGLVNGTPYSVELRAVNAVDAGDASNAVSATPVTVPSAPTITGITPGDTTLSVAFTAGATGGSAITNYKYRLDGGSFVSVGGTSSPFVISGLNNGQEYDVEIRAVNAVGDGAISNLVSATPESAGGIVFVASVSKAGGDMGGTSDAIDTTGANLLVLSLGYYALSTPVVSDSKGNTWTALTGQTVLNTVTSRLYYCATPIVGSGHTFTVSGSSVYASFEVLAVSGAAASPFDQENGASAITATSLATGNVTPSENNELIVAGIGHDNNSGGAVTIDGSGFTAITVPYSLGVRLGCGLAYKIQTTASAENRTWSVVNTCPIAVTIASFKAA